MENSTFVLSEGGTGRRARRAPQAGRPFGRGLAGLFERGFCALVNGRAAKAPGPPAEAGPPERDAFLLGRDLRTGAPVWLCRRDLARHLYVLGSTGCGKTNTLVRLIEADIAARRTVVVLDLRGDLVDRVLRTVAGMPEAPDVFLVDLGQDAFVAGLNPLSGPGEPHSKAFHALEVVKRHSDGWGVQLDETLRHSLVALTEAGMSLAEVDPLLSDGAFRGRIAGRISDPGAAAFFERFDSLSSERRTAMALPVLNKTSPFLGSPCLRRAFGASGGLDIGVLLETPGRVLLVSLAASRHHGFSHLAGGLLVSSLQNAAMARDVSCPPNPVRLYIDEFETMASDSFAAIIAEGRRFGLSLCLSHQNLGQISPVLRDCLRNNAGVQLFFQTGALDAASLAAEVSGLGSKEEARALLTSQKVGEAACLKRAEPTVPLRTVHAEAPAASEEAASRVRRRALARAGVPASEVDAEMARRASGASTGGKPAVRHTRRPLSGPGGE